MLVILSKLCSYDFNYSASKDPLSKQENNKNLKQRLHRLFFLIYPGRLNQQQSFTKNGKLLKPVINILK